MKPINNFYLKIPSRSANESFARVAVSAFVSQLDPTLEELSDIKTAVSEAVTNSIVHAYKNQIGNIYITAEIFENHFPKIKKTKIVLRYGKPIYINELSKEDQKNIGSYFQNVIAEMLEENKALL